MESLPQPSAEASTSSKSPSKNILLHVLSPAVEVPNSRLTFSAVSASTTIEELKKKIQDAISTKPSPERQRLIYRGKALVRNEASLQEVFGNEAVETSEALSLHLVLPPTASTYEPPASTPNGIPRPPYLPNLHMPQRPTNLNQISSGPGIRPFTPPNMNPGGFGAMPHQHLPPSQQLPTDSNQVPPQLQEALSAHFAALAQQFTGQHMPNAPGMNPMSGPFQINAMGAPAFNPMGPPQGPFHQSARHQIPTFAQTAPFQQHIAYQQQARAAARQHGVGRGLDSHDNSRTLANSTPHTNNPSTTDNAQNRAGGPESSNTVYEGQGPNGSSWRMVINEQVISMPNGFRDISQPSNDNSRSNPIGDRQESSSTSTSTTAPTEDEQWELLRERTEALSDSIDTGGFPSEQDALEAQAQLNALVQTNPHPDSNRLWQISYFRLIINRVLQLHNRVRVERAAPSLLSNPLRATTSTQPQTATPSSSPIVYLLSSPSGPQALLVSPSGMYATPGLNVGTAPATIPHVHPHLPTPTTPAALQPANPPNAPNAPNAAAAIPAQPAEPAAPPNEARDLARILLPLGGHLWLLIRLFGFVYFFTSGAGWRRTILLATCALIVFIVQTGVFRPLQTAIWDPFRRHIEGLVPLGAPGAGAVAHANADGDANRPRLDQRGNTGPGRLVPQDVVDRLTRERRQNAGVVRQYLQRAERATALFVASLVPGVGERHIAARDAAEAAARRRAEERERERAAESEALIGDGVQGEGGDGGDEVFSDAVEGVRAERQEQEEGT